MHNSMCAGLTQANILRRIAAAFVLFCLLAASAARADDIHRVLVLNSYHRGFYWPDGLMRGIQAEFAQKDPNAGLYFEHLDTRRFDPNAVFPFLKPLFQSKYKNIKFDVIISCDNNALAFLREYKKELFPNTPIVFVGVSLLEDWMIKGLGPITGIVEVFDKEATIDIALKLHPSAKQVVFVKNRHRDSGIYLDGVVKRFRGRADIVLPDIADMTFEQFLAEVAKLGDESILLLPNVFVDVKDQLYTDAMIAKVFQRCKAPVYVNMPGMVGSGPVGGCINIGERHGALAAGMAIRILNGENAADIPIIKGPSDYKFDYKQLQRFGITLCSSLRNQLLSTSRHHFITVTGNKSGFLRLLPYP